MKATIAALLTIGLASPALAAGSPSQPTPQSVICRQVACRTAPYRFNLRAADGTYELTFDSLPYVRDGVITIYPGEALVFRLSSEGDTPGSPAFVRAIEDYVPNHLVGDDPNAVTRTDPQSGETLQLIRAGTVALENGTAAEHLKGEAPGTLILYYAQAGGDHLDMVLRIEHNLPHSLKLNATIDRIIQMGHHEEPTSTCAVWPLVASHETWPYPIGAIKLSGFRYQRDSGADTEVAVCN